MDRPIIEGPYDNDSILNLRFNGAASHDIVITVFTPLLISKPSFASSAFYKALRFHSLQLEHEYLFMQLA
jgi:hypothetical protein